MQSIAGEEIAQNTRISVLLGVMPQHLRQHIQLTMDDKTTYSELREKLLSFERTATSYSSSSVYRQFDIGRREDKHDESVPMDIDRIKGKVKGKAKGKGKGKDKGKGSLGATTLPMTRAKARQRAQRAQRVARMMERERKG